MTDHELSFSDVQRTMDASAHRVFHELSDGWAFVGWVVGATHIRDVDPGWPAVGTRIHHKIGSWPVVLADTTESWNANPIAGYCSKPAAGRWARPSSRSS